MWCCVARTGHAGPVRSLRGHSRTTALGAGRLRRWRRLDAHHCRSRCLSRSPPLGVAFVYFILLPSGTARRQTHRLRQKPRFRPTPNSGARDAIAFSELFIVEIFALHSPMHPLLADCWEGRQANRSDCGCLPFDAIRCVWVQQASENCNGSNSAKFENSKSENAKFRNSRQAYFLGFFRLRA